MKNIAIILAGGSGTRLGGNLPKQFLKVAGKSIIEHTLDVFENNVNIDEIAVVTQEQYLTHIEDFILKNGYTKIKKILVGGKERYDSSLSAIAAYADDSNNLIFHDAVRPLINNRIIDDCIKALEDYEAIDVAIDTTDTIINVDDENTIKHIPVRSELRNGQTPQCFKRGLIKRAYDLALADPNFITTDDCGVVKKYLPDVKIKVVEGEVFNMKITYEQDIFLLDKLFQLKSTYSHYQTLNDNAGKSLANKVMVVFGGSYGIGKDIVDIARSFGAIVYTFSRSENNVDVADKDAISASLCSVYNRNGRIDYVVSTAGILNKEPLNAMDYDSIINSLNVNLLGTINVAKESYKYLKETKGSLLFYTSSSYTRGRMMYSVYSATKAAIVNFVQAIAEEWFSDDVRVNCINPERTKTPMRTKSFGLEPEGTLLKPEDVAIASLNVVTADCTGQVFDVKLNNKTEKI